MRISNAARAAVWLVLLACLPICGPGIDKTYRLSCPSIACIAAGVILLAIVLRASAVTGRYLAVYGKSSPDKSFGEIDKLVDVGPYSCMRHPMHFFLSLLPISIGLILASPGAVLLGAIEAALILALAVWLDEKESMERFGKAYAEYRKRVPAFNPRPSCLYKSLAHRPPKPPGKRKLGGGSHLPKTPGTSPPFLHGRKEPLLER